MSATLPATARTEQSARDAMTDTAKDAAALEVRIRAPFGEVATSVDIANLITEVERAAITSAEVAERARLQALDPALGAADVAATRRAMEDACFERDRMHEAVRRLGARLREVKAQEEQARRRAAHNVAVAERDKLATELAEVYPAVAERLADLAARIAANDAAIERVNRKLPDGSKWIDSAELIARNLRNFNDGTADIPRITKHMRLPAFQYAGLSPYTWPRPI